MSCAGLHPKQMYEKFRQWNWRLSSNQTPPLSVSRPGITLSTMVLWILISEVPLHGWWNFSTQAGDVWHDDHGADPACANLQANDNAGRKSVHWLPLVTACSSFCERVFSPFSHLPTRAGSLSCNTAPFWGGDAFQAVPAPVAWIRNLHSAWWMQLLLTQTSGWMFH